MEREEKNKNVHYYLHFVQGQPLADPAYIVIFATHPDAGMLKAVCGSDCHSTETPLPVSGWQTPPYCPSNPWERVSKFHDPLRCHGAPVYHNRV